MKATLNLIFILVFFPACSYHVGTISGGSGLITNNQFSNIDFAYGTAQTVHVFGIGGNEKDALVLEAKRNLYLNQKLKPSQVIGQTTIDFKRTFFFPVFITKVTISAEIIDFSTNALDTAQIQVNKNEFISAGTKGMFEFGEEVIYNNGTMTPATILGFEKNKYVIKFIDYNNNLKIRRISPLQLKPMQKTISGRKLGKLYTPRNPKRELISFRYKDEKYTGELVEKSGNKYLIKMEKEDGSTIGIYVPQKDILQ